MVGKLTLCSGVVGGLMWGALLLHHPRELGREVAARVALKEVVKFADMIS